jgi:hypothetical protein
MTDTYHQDPNTLPPLTKAIVNTYGPNSNFGRPSSIDDLDAAIIDAIHALEARVIALETP